MIPLFLRQVARMCIEQREPRLRYHEKNQRLREGVKLTTNFSRTVSLSIPPKSFLQRAFIHGESLTCKGCRCFLSPHSERVSFSHTFSNEKRNTARLSLQCDNVTIISTNAHTIRRRPSPLLYNVGQYDLSNLDMIS